MHNNATNNLCVLSELTEDGICVITLNRPKRLNGWNAEMIDGFTTALRDANSNPQCVAVIMTAKGRYFSSGADFAIAAPQLPSSLKKFAIAQNYRIFDAFITLDKPLVIAAQGPAVGGAVTVSCSLSDYIITSKNSTWHTPFVQLGVTPEGCAEYTFPLRLSPGAADTMLLKGEKVDAYTALEMKLVNEIVDTPNMVLPRAIEVVRTLLAGNIKRWETVPAFVREMESLGGGQSGRAAFVDVLKSINLKESKRLGRSILSKKFFMSQQKAAEKRGKTKAAWIFWLLGKVQPVLSRL